MLYIYHTSTHPYFNSFNEINFDELLDIALSYEHFIKALTVYTAYLVNTKFGESECNANYVADI